MKHDFYEGCDFRIGDKVIVVQNSGYGHFKLGMTGTVLDFYVPVSYVQGVMVRWDIPKPSAKFHSCGRLCEEGYGWNVQPECLALLSREEIIHQIDISDADLLGLVAEKGVV